MFGLNILFRRHLLQPVKGMDLLGLEDHNTADDQACWNPLLR